MLFFSGLARSPVVPLVAAATAPWVCGRSSIPSCVSGHADGGSPGSNYPSTTRVSSTVREAEKLCRPLFVLGRPCRTWMNHLNHLPLLMASLVLRQESFWRNSQHLLTIVLRVHATPPPPPPARKQASSGLSLVHSKRLPVHPRRWPVHPNSSPTMFEVLTGEFRWHLRRKDRRSKGRSGGLWAEDLLRWLGEGGATGRRR